MLVHHPLLPLNVSPAKKALMIVSESSTLRPAPLLLKKAMRVLVMPKNRMIEMRAPYRRGGPTGDAEDPRRVLGGGQAAAVGPQPRRREEQERQEQNDDLEEPEL